MKCFSVIVKLYFCFLVMSTKKLERELAMEELAPPDKPVGLYADENAADVSLEAFIESMAGDQGRGQGPPTRDALLEGRQ